MNKKNQPIYIIIITVIAITMFGVSFSMTQHRDRDDHDHHIDDELHKSKQKPELTIADELNDHLKNQDMDRPRQYNHSDNDHLESDQPKDHMIDHHDDCDLDQHLGHDHDGEELEVHFNNEEQQMSGLTLEHVVEDFITITIELPGEVGFNEDNLANIVPRFPGIAHKINKKIGEYVRKGDVLAVIESNESLMKYEIKSLLPGTVIEKNIVVGEFVSDDSSIYTIADLSTVWIDFAVNSQNAQNVKSGQKISIEQIGSQLWTEGKIAYLSPVYDKHSRSILARVVVPNENNTWRPGTFVRGFVNIETPNKVPVVHSKAVQLLNEKTVVFVPETENIFIAKPVALGERTESMVHIKTGLDSGQEYVVNGAYELKAKLITSSLDSHAGHGH